MIEYIREAEPVPKEHTIRSLEKENRALRQRVLELQKSVTEAHYNIKARQYGSAQLELEKVFLK